MWAPRALACSSSSRTSAAPPSAMTKPSRRTSNGLDSPDVESAVMLPKAAIATPRVIAASAPPVRTASQRPLAIKRWPASRSSACRRRTRSTIVSQGPRQPKRIEIAAAPAFAIIIGTRNGDTRRGPFSNSTPIWSCHGREPADAGTDLDTGQRRVDVDSPASSRAMTAAPTANWAKRSTRRTSFGVEPDGGVEADHAVLARGGRPVDAGPEVVLAGATTRDDAESGDRDPPATASVERHLGDRHQSFEVTSS